MQRQALGEVPRYVDHSKYSERFLMSLSEMSRTRYKELSTLLRANGSYHGLKWILDPLEREDMRYLDNLEYDHLLQRLAFQKLGREKPKTAFMLTTPFRKTL
jgi:hypothetical protein